MSRRRCKSSRQHSVELLEPRALLAATLAVVDPLQQRVRERIGMAGDALNDILGRRALEAPGSASSQAAPYIGALSARAARTIEPSVSAVSFSATAIDEAAVASVIRSAPIEALARGLTIDALPVIYLPTPAGGLARFAMEGYDLLAPQVAAQFPTIRSVRLFGLDDTLATGVATMTELGLSASVLSSKGNWSVAPLTKNSADNSYASYFDSLQVSRITNPDGTSVLQSSNACVCCTSALHSVMNTDTNSGLSHTQMLSGGLEGVDALVNRGPVRKTYRFAYSTTAEFTALYGSQGAAVAGISSAVANMNAIYTRDLSINFTIVSDTRTVYTNAGTDPFNNAGTQASMYEANQTTLNSTYTFAGYDVGHVFAQASGMSGVAVVFTAGSGSLGQSFKAKAVTQGTPAAANFQHVFMHEVGHQVGGEHIFNYLGTPPNANREAVSATEPGPGSSIMSYGGIGFAGDFVTVADSYFNVRNIDGIESYLTNNATAAALGTVTNTGNVAPEVTAPPDRTIPANTPFELTGQAWDSAGQSLTYTWEQLDLGDEDPIGVDDGDGPLFRSRLGTADTTRTFPELADILNGTSSPDETLPQVSRSVDPLTFRVTVRDQLGGVSDDVMNLPVVNTGSAFAITSQNGPIIEAWAPGSTQTITWNVAGTTGNGINTSQVDIFISYDGGTTFTPMFFGANNDGSQQVTVPTDAPIAGNARVKVKAVDNYFFDINNFPIFVNGNAALNGLPATAPAAELPLYGSISGAIRDVDHPLMGSAPEITFVGDTDTYLFSPPATAPYIIETGRTGASTVDTVLSVYDDLTGAQLAINDDYLGSTATSRVVIGLEAGKKYRISVGDFGSDTAGDVFLTLQGTAAAPVTSSFLLNSAGDGSTTGNLVSSRSANFHQFFVPSLYTGSGSISVTAPTAQTTLSLYDADQNLVAFSTTGTLSGLSSLNIGHTYTIRVGTQNYSSGGGAYTINVDLGTLATPGAPDLASFSDAGQSDTDNRTNDNLGLSFAVPAGMANRFMRLFRNGVLVAGPTQVPANGVLSMVDAGPVPDGTHSYTFTAALTSTGGQTPASTALSVTVDTAAPSWIFDGFDFNIVADHSFLFAFNEPVYGFSSSDPIIQNTTTSQPLPSSSLTAQTINSSTYRVHYNPTAGNDYIPDGRYSYDLPSSAVFDIAGNPYVNEFPTATFFLNGDANRDARVNFDDLLILAANYNTGGRTFTLGDFTYDGTVNFDDLLILAARYNVSLPSTPDALLAGNAGTPRRPGAFPPPSSDEDPDVLTGDPNILV